MGSAGGKIALVRFGQWTVVIGLAGAACGDGLGAVPVKGDSSSTDPLDHGGWFELGQGEGSWLTIGVDAPLELVLGHQGALMFPISVRAGGFPLAEAGGAGDESHTPHVSLWLDVPGYNRGATGYFAATSETPVPFELRGDGAYEYSYVPLIVPDYEFDLSQVDGSRAVLSASLAALGHGLDAAQPMKLRLETTLSMGEHGSDENGATGDGDDDDGDDEVGHGNDGIYPHFVDATEEAGLVYDHGPKNYAPDCYMPRQMGSPPGDECRPERMAGAAAVADYDDDGDLDIFLPTLAGPNRLFENDGSGHFVDVAVAVGVDLPDRAAGAVWGDFDNDGAEDLMVTRVGDYRHSLLMNDGTGRFEEVAVERGVSAQSEWLHGGTTPNTGDFDRDGFLDLFVGEWFVYQGFPDGTHHTRVFRSLGSAAPGYFEDVNDELGFDFLDADRGYPGPAQFAMVFADLDLDGWTDLLAIGDFGSSKLYWNEHDGSFSDGTDSSGIGPLAFYAMGGTVADFDRDGLPDVYTTDIHENGAQNRLFMNQGDRTFVDRSAAYGVEDGYWGWGALAIDYDNDGDHDLAETNGWSPLKKFNSWSRFWRNRGRDRKMTEMSSHVGIQDDGLEGRAVVQWDYDDDGDLDMFIAYAGERGTLYRNEGGNKNGWLRVKLRGTTTNRDAIGARVYVRTNDTEEPRYTEYGVNAAFMGHGERIAHFGLGPGTAPVAEVRIVWPASGAEQVLHDVARNQTIELIEPG